MARSTRIYIVTTAEPDSETLAAFTVKHELKAWLKTKADLYESGMSSWANYPLSAMYVTSIPDGWVSPGQQTTLPAEEYIKEVVR